MLIPTFNSSSFSSSITTHQASSQYQSEQIQYSVKYSSFYNPPTLLCSVLASVNTVSDTVVVVIYYQLCKFTFKYLILKSRFAQNYNGPSKKGHLKIIRMTYKYVLREKKRVLSFLECLEPVVHPSGQLYREF